MQVTTVTTEGNYKYNPHISPFPLIGLYSKQVYWVYIKGGIINFCMLYYLTTILEKTSDHMCTV